MTIVMIMMITTSMPIMLIMMVMMSERTIYVHPSSDRTKPRICSSTDPERVFARRAVRQTGLRDQLQALHPELPPPLYPRRPQPQVGAESVPHLLLVGRRQVLGLSGSRVGAATPAMLVALAASGSGSTSDAVARAGASASCAGGRKRCCGRGANRSNADGAAYATKAQ